MAAVFKFKVESKGAQIKLRALGKGANDRETLEYVGYRMMRFIDRQYDTNGGGSWSPIATNTRLKKGAGKGPLQDKGHLRKSWHIRVTKGYSVSISSQDPTAEFHEYGTRPHTITAHGRALRFPTLGGMRYPKTVNHPGEPARPVFPPRDHAKFIIELAVLIRNRMLRGTGGA